MASRLQSASLTCSSKLEIGERLAFQADGQLTRDENEIAIGAALRVMAGGLGRGIRGNLLDGVRLP